MSEKFGKGLPGGSIKGIATINVIRQHTNQEVRAM